MKDARLFHPVPLSLFRCGRDWSLALVPEGGTIRIDALATRVFGFCQGFKTLEAHTAAAWRAGAGPDPDALAAAIHRLVAFGMLRPADFVQHPLAAGSGATRDDIDSVVIVTADRPRTLARGLTSVVRHLQAFEHEPRIIVVDGSREFHAETEAAVGEVRAATAARIEYVGQIEAARLRHQLTASGSPDPLLRMALVPGSIGCNRNLAVLLTAGERGLMIDDDVLCDTWAPGGATDDVVVGGHVDMREWRFFAGREEALAAMQREPRDLIAAHGRVLGRSLQSLLEPLPAPPDLQHACGHIVSAMAGRTEPRVRITMAGLAGDSARYCAHRLLFAAGTVREVFRADPASLATALTSREVHNVARRVTVMHEPMCMSYCMGLANDGTAPPFLPSGRGEDSVFGAMLAFVATDTLFAHLPCGIVHDSARPSAYGASEHVASARQTRLAEFVMAVVMNASQSAISSSPGARLAQLGQMFGDLGGLPQDEFIAFASRGALQLRCNQISGLEGMLAGLPNRPQRWQAALDEYRMAFETASAAPAFFLPVEFAGARTLGDGFAAMQAFTTSLGMLLQQWPQIWASAADMNRARRASEQRSVTL